ncbi:MAG: hypothetical protein II915_03840, partial [Eubacterium sp.]|nr:hypothetical protein [Eubacterium sp.]
DSQLEHPSTYSLAYRTGVTNNQKKVTIEVEKLDGYSSDRAAHGDATLEGAKFQLYADPSCTTKATVYDEDGTATEADEYTISGGKLETDYLLTGINYYLRETQAPTGYLINDTVYTLSVDGAGISVEHTRGASSTEVSDQPILGKVAIQKYYNEDEPAILNPESGAKFQIYLKSAGSYDAANATYERDELTTDGTGYAVSKDLYYGTYVVHQVDTGSVDTVKMPDFEVTINENGKTYFYPLRNPYFRAFLKVIKLDKNTGKTVLKPGTAYQIYKVDDAGKEEKVVQTYSNGNKTVDVDTFTTDATGEIMTVKELKSGKYRIYETDAASGLHITKKYIEVTINSKLNNYTEWLDAEGNKHVTVSVTYENEETKAKVTIKKTGEKLASYDPMRKDFIFSDAPLNGAVFEIYADGDIVTQDNQGTTWYKNGELVTTVTTGVDAKFSREASDITGYTLNTDGSVEVSLPLGKYKVKEVKTPYGYVFPDTHEWNLEFNWKNANDPFVINSTSATDAAGTLNVKNSYAATKIELVKQDEYTKLPIKGAVFGLYTKTPIYNASGEKIVEADTEISTLTTDEEGRAVCLTKLPLMDENYPKSITTGQAVTVSGQTLGIQPSQQSVTLNSGDYYLKELDVSKSYYLDEERIPVHLEYKDAETKVIEASVEMTNVQTVTEISKTDIAGSEEIPGCELSITDKDGNTIISWVSGEPESMKISENAEQMGYNNLSAEVSDTGSLIIRGLLHDTEYTLTEVRPADGYVTADNIDFMVKGKVQTVELPPAPTTSSTDAVSGQAVSGTSAHVPGAEHT